MPELSNPTGIWPVATVIAPGHLNDNSLPESGLLLFAMGRPRWLSSFWVSKVVRGLVLPFPSRWGCLFEACCLLPQRSHCCWPNSSPGAPISLIGSQAVKRGALPSLRMVPGSPGLKDTALSSWSPGRWRSSCKFFHTQGNEGVLGNWVLSQMTPCPRAGERRWPKPFRNWSVRFPGSHILYLWKLTPSRLC